MYCIGMSVWVIENMRVPTWIDIIEGVHDDNSWISVSVFLSKLEFFNNVTTLKGAWGIRELLNLDNMTKTIYPYTEIVYTVNVA